MKTAIIGGGPAPFLAILLKGWRVTDDVTVIEPTKKRDLWLWCRPNEGVFDQFAEAVYNA